MRKRGKSDRLRERDPTAAALVNKGLSWALCLFVVSMAIPLLAACGGTSSETPYPREPVPDDPLAESATGGTAPS